MLRGEAASDEVGFGGVDEPRRGVRRRSVEGDDIGPAGVDRLDFPELFEILRLEILLLWAMMALRENLGLFGAGRL